MKTIQVTRYSCELCGGIYETEKEARFCESCPVSKEKGVRIGDIVRVIAGDGTGARAKVTSISICSGKYGHYAWAKYRHTVAVHADFLDQYGSRFLLFDSYEVEG